MTLEQGILLNGRYRIVDILGQGGMGSVYRAMDENLGVEVAVKENLFTTDEYSRQFRLEAVILASLRHPNLPRVTDHYVIDTEGQYLVMDYIEGEDLRQRMERLITITEEDAILVGAAIADALAYLHTRKPPVLHRDIKPGNVKITSEGHVYLVDFGLAKLIQGSQTTTTGARAMTPGYSPPEQYGTARTDPRSDIYSLGATLYAALTGVIPEDGLARVMDNVQLTPLRKHNPNISRRLATAIEKAMEAYPDDRFQNAEDFRKALLNSSSKTQRLIDLDLNISVSPPPSNNDNPTEGQPGKPPSSPVSTFTDSLTSATSRFKRRSRKLASSGVWMGVAFLAMAFMFLVNRGSLASAFVAVLPPNVVQTYMPVAAQVATQNPIELPLVGAESTATLEPTASPSPLPTATSLPSPTSTPPGGTGIIAFASSRDGVPQIYLMNADGSNIRPLTNEQDGACQPDWSPDGLHLVYISPCKARQDSYPGSSLYVMDADGSNKTALPTTLGGDFEPAWSPDGTRIAFTSTRDGFFEIYALNLETNQIEKLTDAQKISASSYARQPAWNPFGNQLAYVLKRVGVTQIWLTRGLPVTVQQFNDQLTDNTINASLPAWSPNGEFIVFNQTSGDSPAWLMRLRYEDRASRNAIRVDVDPPILDVSFSPDGFWIAFESKPSENASHDIYLITVTGAGKKQLTTDPSADFDPVWRPLPRSVLP
jgi:serine/threonine protein kinase